MSQRPDVDRAVHARRHRHVIRGTVGRLLVQEPEGTLAERLRVDGRNARRPDAQLLDHFVASRRELRAILGPQCAPGGAEPQTPALEPQLDALAFQPLEQHAARHHMDPSSQTSSPASGATCSPGAATNASSTVAVSWSMLGPWRNWIIGRTTPRSASTEFFSCTAINESNPSADKGTVGSSLVMPMPRARAEERCR